MNTEDFTLRHIGPRESEINEMLEILPLFEEENKLKKIDL